MDITEVEGKILGWMAAMTKYGDGVYVDSSATDESTPGVALANMNKRTDRVYEGNNSVICARDYWTFDTTNCTLGASESVYSPGSTD